MSDFSNPILEAAWRRARLPVFVRYVYLGLPPGVTATLNGQPCMPIETRVWHIGNSQTGASVYSFDAEKARAFYIQFRDRAERALCQNTKT